MKRKVIVFTVFILFGVNIYSQETPALKFIDIYGNFYLSSDFAEKEQYLFINFFNLGCGSCHLWMPVLDSYHEYFGCNCGDVFFVAINAANNSTNKAVFEFTQEYNMNFPAVSAEGNGYFVADLLDVSWTPYMVVISPDNRIVLDTSVFVTNYEQKLLDTLKSFGLEQNVCRGNDFKYYEIRTDADTFVGVVDVENKKIDLKIPTNKALTNARAFFITSSKSTTYIDGVEQISDETIVDLQVNRITYRNVSEVDTVFSDWTVYINSGISTNEIPTKNFIYPNPSNGYVYLEDYSKIEIMNVYSMDGRLISSVKPSRNDQNFNLLGAGTYIIYIKTNDGVYSEKMIIK